LTSTDTSASGIHVVEGLSRGQAIPVDGDSVTAFIAPTPRGPVDRAVEITSLEQFEKIFDLPGNFCRLAGVIRDFFANGGTNAMVVRISGTSRRARMCLPGPGGDLILEARNPGASEFLRAAIDYDGIDPDGYLQFNLVLQRLRAPDSAWIETQECFRRVSVESASRDYVGYVLNQSELATLVNEAPPARPHATCETGTLRQPIYVNGQLDSVVQTRPTDYDIIGSEQSGTGLNALEHVEDIGQVCLLAGSSRGPGPLALLAADKFCRRHQSMLIIDPPAKWQSVSAVIQDHERRAFSSPNAMTWFPGLHTKNSAGSLHAVSAMGAIAAALSSSTRPGVSHLVTAPAFAGSTGSRPAVEVDQADARRLRRMGINILSQTTPLHFRLDGNVTQVRNESLSADWQALDLRYQALFILRRIRNATRWTFFHKSDREIWTELSAQITEFLSELHHWSMLAGRHASEAFYVKCDLDTNHESAGKTGEVSLVIGFALRRPGEFLAFRMQRAHGGCRIVELGWDSGLEMAS
jgi:hypothetical protein